MVRRGMLDIETLSAKKNAAVISIGLVGFDDNGLAGTYYAVLETESQIARGCDISLSTMHWWMQQSHEAKAVFDMPGRSTVDVLHELAKVIISNCDELWGNGSDFDNVILENLYDRFNIPLPWKHTSNRCYRTVKALAKASGYEPAPFAGVKHNALADAEHQAMELRSMLHHLRL